MAKTKLRVIPLGGVGEVGKNCLLFEQEGELLMVDAGVKFPEEEQYGVDLVIPDISFILERADDLKGIVVTHGHEDHIGAIPYFLLQLERKIPIYGTSLTLGLVGARLREHNVQHLAEMIQVPCGEQFNVGRFQVELFPVNHSIPDAAGVVIRGAPGTLIFTSDFKIDETPVDGVRTDLEFLRRLGDEGVMALLSDAVRADRPGATPSERIVMETLDRLIREATGRVLVTTFASNLSRIRQVIRSAHAYDKKVAVVGRSLDANMKVAKELGYLDVPEGAVVDISETRKLPPDKVVLLTTGSQGEPSSALSRIALDDHSQIKVGKGDTVIIAATPVPGNEKTVARTIDNLFRRGARVLYGEIVQTLHVSGHASRDDLRRVVELVRPRFCVPMHGEYRHLVLYRDLAGEAGVPPERVLILDLGETLEFQDGTGRKGARIPIGSVLVDSVGVGKVTQVTLRDRRRLALDGIVIVAVTLDRDSGEIITGPEVLARGFVEPGDGQVLEKAKERATAALKHTARGEVEYGYLVHRIREVVGELIYKQTKRRPLVLPVVTEI